MSRIYPVRDALPVDISSADFTTSAGFNNVWVGTTGNVAVITADGRIITYPNALGGMWHAIQGKGISKTLTTASNLLVGLS